MVNPEDNWNADQIYTKANNPQRTDQELIPLLDIKTLLASDFRLYSWGNNGITFKKENLWDLSVGRVEDGYRLQLQYTSREQSQTRYNLTACEQFFKKEAIKINDADHWREFDINDTAESCGELHTQGLPLENTIELYSKFRNKTEQLHW